MILIRLFFLFSLQVNIGIFFLDIFMIYFLLEYETVQHSKSKSSVDVKRQDVTDNRFGFFWN